MVVTTSQDVGTIFVQKWR
jgi:hypothetical protein